MSAPVIKKLDQTTVNRIAAGEVVQKPSAAIKEMLENSLDAGATSIAITSKNGGLALLQISDNGHGINKDDLAIVCERFTTSKLATYDDLKTVSTFGFRGEALASITHVAHVTIQTKTATSPCAYKAKYSDGKLVPMKPGATSVDPVACAGVNGTTITVEDLFYNMQTRKQAFKNPNEQYQKILDIVMKYAIHYGDKKVAFTCKKVGQTTPDFHTPGGSSTLENLKIAFGPALARELLPFSLSIDEPASSREDSAAPPSGDRLVVAMDGYLSSANYASKKSTCIIFINNRLVECQNLKRVIENVYNDVLPKHCHPFVYLSVTMPFEHVDVNVHPTKKEVHFLFEEQLLLRLFTSVFERLRSANESRTFYTQSLLLGQPHSNPSSSGPNEQEEEEGIGDGGGRGPSSIGSSAGDAERVGVRDAEALGSKRRAQSSGSSAAGGRPGGVSANKLIRVDATVAKIDSFFRARSGGTVEEEEEGEEEEGGDLVFCENCTLVNSNVSVGSGSAGKGPRAIDRTAGGACSCCNTLRGAAPPAAPASSSRLPPLQETSCEYTSVQSLLKDIKCLSHGGLSKMLRSHSFVGVLNSRYCIVQFDTRLLMLDHSRLLQHLFYQLAIRQFGCVAAMTIAGGRGVAVRDFILAALDLPEAQWDSSRGSKESVADAAAQLLASKAELLSEYFRIDMDPRGMLTAMPALLTGYTPCAQQLPLFLLR